MSFFSKFSLSPKREIYFFHFKYYKITFFFCIFLSCSLGQFSIWRIGSCPAVHNSYYFFIILSIYHQEENRLCASHLRRCGRSMRQFRFASLFSRKRDFRYTTERQIGTIIWYNTSSSNSNTSKSYIDVFR